MAGDADNEAGTRAVPWLTVVQTATRLPNCLEEGSWHQRSSTLPSAAEALHPGPRRSYPSPAGTMHARRATAVRGHGRITAAVMHGRTAAAVLTPAAALFPVCQAPLISAAAFSWHRALPPCCAASAEQGSVVMLCPGPYRQGLRPAGSGIAAPPPLLPFSAHSACSLVLSMAALLAALGSSTFGSSWPQAAPPPALPEGRTRMHLRLAASRHRAGGRCARALA